MVVCHNSPEARVPQEESAIRESPLPSTSGTGVGAAAGTPVQAPRRSARLAGRQPNAQELSVAEQTLSDAHGSASNFGELASLASASPRERTVVEDFVDHRQAILRFVRDRVAEALDLQKQNADARGRRNQSASKSEILLSTDNLPTHAVSNLGSNKRLPRYVGPFKIMHRQGDAYTLDFPKRTRLHPTFYVGRLKAYHRHADAFPSDQQRPVNPRGLADEDPNDEPVPAEDDVSPPPELQGCTGGRCERPSAAARSRDSRGSTPSRADPSRYS
ncbi:TPA: LOW QUALITY PROTEIN: hypothetical protein N0F65_008132 [Lagenidium giganteum]|uniref:Tf2-1-like SH3-like domain-containing protein n=1 Tax=Lagenidium giganteum TaxID=4803 RepID=A0AAV2YYW7_9STRA|nr:TPA: LOW QUALITY PROTEIN: hypothetical protein N0F65_008132 [Lagenidium giganteum]